MLTGDKFISGLQLRLQNQPELFFWNGVLKIYSKSTGEHPCWSAISIKWESNFIEITLWHGCSPVNLQHISRTLFRKNSAPGSGFTCSTCGLFTKCRERIRKSKETGVLIHIYKNKFDKASFALLMLRMLIRKI